MATASEFVAMAQGQIGVCESPANSNMTKYGKWYGLDGQPWCDMFISWCAEQAGALDIVGKYAWTPSHAQFFKDAGRWLDRADKPQPGDIAFFANASGICHVGIVESRNGSTSVTTIEGNTSAGDNANGGQVQRRNRTYGTVGSNWYIAGFGRPDWDGEGDRANGASDSASNAESEVEEVHDFGLVKAGQTGNHVKVCQAALNVRNGAGLDVDGIYGSRTCAAIRVWQRTHGLEADGECGVLTWGSLLRA